MQENPETMRTHISPVFPRCNPVAAHRLPPVNNEHTVNNRVQRKYAHRRSLVLTR